MRLGDFASPHAPSRSDSAAGNSPEKTAPPTARPSASKHGHRSAVDPAAFAMHANVTHADMSCGLPWVPVARLLCRIGTAGLRNKARLCVALR